MSMKRKLPRCCPTVLGTRLKRDDAEELATAFKAIADPGRLRLLSFIAGQPGAEACVCHLIQPLGLAQPTVSHHLKVLTEAGLLARERRGTWMFYRLVPERVEALPQALALPSQKPVAKRSALPFRRRSNGEGRPPGSLRRPLRRPHERPGHLTACGRVGAEGRGAGPL